VHQTTEQFPWQKVRELSYKDEVVAGRKIQQLIHALSEVREERAVHVCC
jgi:hypothetical protein